MGIYQEHFLPYLINLAMRNRRLMPYRERVTAAAEGRVLEIGIGSGLNLPLYARNVSDVIGLEPSTRVLGGVRPKYSRTFQRRRNWRPHYQA